MLIFDDSSWHEELTLNWLRQSLYRIHSEQMALDLPGALPWLKGRAPWLCQLCTKRVGHDVHIPADTLHGHLDALFTDLYDTDRLLEHKAIEYFVFQNYWSGDKLPLDYFAQCVVYFRALQLVQPHLTEGVLLIKNKDTSAYMEYVLLYDNSTDTLSVPEMIYSTGERKALHLTYRGLYAAVLHKFEIVETHLRENTLPERQIDDDDWRCRYCTFKEICWEDYQPPVLDQTVSLPPSLEQLAHEYLRLDRDIKPKKKRLEELKQDLTLALYAMRAEEARGEQVLIQIKKSARSGIDQQRLPTSLKELYSKTTIAESLKVRALPVPATNPQTPSQPVSRDHLEAA
jgi:hypothetical protein